MRKKFSKDNRGIALQILQVLGFMLFAVLMYFIFSMMFSTTSNTATDLNNGYYEDGVSDIILYLDAISGPGFIVIALLMSLSFLYIKSVVLNQFN